jgi:cell wall-associated NlpC family hydrolase
MSRRSVSPHRGGGLLQARRLTLGLALGLALSATTLTAPAGATPQSDLLSKTAQAQRLEAQISANSTQADILDEQFLQARSAVSDLNRQIASAEAGIAAARKQQAGLRSRLGGRAALLYMGAGSGDPLGIDATNVQELGARAKYGEAAAETDARMIDKLKVLDEQLGIQTQDLEKVKREAQKRQNEADTARQALEKIDTRVKQLLGSTKSDIRVLANKIETQRIAAQAAAERARFQAAARQAAATQRSGGGGGVSSNAADIGVDPGSIPAPNGGASAAIAYARQQIGKPYQYAGTGPGAFDCSGLTMMAWAQGGVSMSHGSQAQYLAFPKVPISQLQPGDLVFFGSSGPSNHHVGLYIGGGTMIEAPHSGAYVRYTTIYRPDLIPLGSRP